ncbi:amidase signature domain-containing protein [Baffinella frigidus]|nr:amidase signature domain-containing protein [Cryptophyta sp. CCMP2293]
MGTSARLGLSDGLLGLSAVRQAELLRERTILSVDLLGAYIARIRQVARLATQPGSWVVAVVELRCEVDERFEAALEEAKQADKRLDQAAFFRGESFPLPPLLGVPFSAKEAFAVQGMPNTSGLVSRIGVRAASDAAAVARLKEAGAICICVSNCSELCMWMESYNFVYGLTNNPYSRAHSVGGSSGGEAALVSAACVSFGLGSDVGGSIRIPAAFCGIFGHKCTGGVVSNDGQYPIAGGSCQKMLTTGPMARHAIDLLPLLRALSPATSALSDRKLDLRRLRVVSIAQSGVPFTRPVPSSLPRAALPLFSC